MIARIARIVAVALAASVLAGALTAVWLARTGACLDLARFARPDDGLVVLDRHGTPLRHVRGQGVDRRWVPLAEVSRHLIDAFIAAEDARFFDHHGASFSATARAVLDNVIPWRRRSGASTLTQQLVKLVYGRPAGVFSKALEIVRAIALERRFDKREILEQYLNRVPFGDGIVGVGRASEAYFGVPVSELTVAQAALLAGVPQAPSITEPRRHLARALSRRAYVLGRMRTERLIDDEAWRRAMSETPVIREAGVHAYEAPRFVDAALDAWRSGSLAQRAGVLRTSLDLPVQQSSESLLRAAVGRFESRGATNGAALVVRNDTGEVLAYVGAAREGETAPGGQLDLLRCARQPGSTLKPFAYELLFERGGTTATVLDDVQTPLSGADGASYVARDFDGGERGPVRARVALASSLNLAALDVIGRVGSERFVRRLRALDLLEARDTSTRVGGAVVLGGASVSAWNLAHAYVSLARGGESIALALAPQPRVEARRVMLADAAALTWDILADPEARADAFGASLTDLAPGVPFALKTGTSSSFRDAWAAVMSSAFTVVVWLGDPSGVPMSRVSGFEAAAPVAVRVLAAAHARTTELGVPPAPVAGSRRDADGRPSLESVDVCAWSGLRLGPRCHHAVRERFVVGGAPRDRCDQHDTAGHDLVPHRLRAWLDRRRPAGVAVDQHAVAGTRRGATLVVSHPRDGARLLIDGNLRASRLPLRASLGAHRDVAAAFEVDGARIPDARWRLEPGVHEVVAIVGAVRSAPARIVVATLRGG